MKYKLAATDVSVTATAPHALHGLMSNTCEHQISVVSHIIAVTGAEMLCVFYEDFYKDLWGILYSIISVQSATLRIFNAC